MSFENDQLWQAFLTEVGEQLDCLEVELAKSEFLDIDKLHHIFRIFHSVKSSCAMFDFGAMEAMAHAAENILDQLRNDIIQIDNNILNLLLACVDCLKQQLSESRQSMQAPAQNEELLSSLLALNTKDLPSRFDAPEDEVFEAEFDAVEIEEFARFSSNALDKILTAITNQELSKAERPLKQFVRNTENMGFLRLKKAVLNLKSYLDKGEGQDQSLAGAFFDVLAQFKVINRLTHQDFEAINLHESMCVLFQEHYVASNSVLHSALLSCESLSRTNNAVSNDEYTALISAVEDAANFYMLFQLFNTQDLLLYIVQVLKKIQLNQAPSSVLRINDTLCLIKDCEAEFNNFTKLMELDRQAKSLLEAYRNIVGQTIDEGFHRVDRIAAITSQLNIEPDFLDYADNGEIEFLEFSLKEEKTIVLITVDLEADQQWSLGFIEWLNQYELVTSRTVLCSKESGDSIVEYTKTAFLMVFEQDASVVLDQIKQLDPDSHYIEEAQLVNRDENESVPQAKHLQNKAVKAFEGNTSAESEANKTIRVSSEYIDRFVSRVGEMVLQRNMLNHAMQQGNFSNVINKCKAIVAELHTDGDNDLTRGLQDNLNLLSESFSALNQANDALSSSINLVQNDLMGFRVVPISIVFNRLPRVIRNINLDQDKDIYLEIHGDDIRIDKSMVDILMEPMIHLVRNSADHGIESREQRLASGKSEQGCIQVNAEQLGSVLLVRIKDDGRGLDNEKIMARAKECGLYNDAIVHDEKQLQALIFQPGFSTKDEVNETSGRGVGMDVVQSKIHSVGGRIEITSTPQQGTEFTLYLPLTAAIQGAILFSYQNQLIAVPERNVIQGLSISSSEIQQVQGQAALVYRGDILPLYSIGEVLEWAKSDNEDDDEKSWCSSELDVLIVTNEKYQIGLAVDKVETRQELFIRELHDDILKLPGVGGASITGSGQVILLLDIDEIISIASGTAQNIQSMPSVS